MPGRVYKVIEHIGTSPMPEKTAAAIAEERAPNPARAPRIAAIAQLDMQLKDGKVPAYRATMKVHHVATDPRS